MEEERSKAIAAFEQIYRSLQKKYNLRLHSVFSTGSENLMEIYEYIGEIKGDCICTVRDSDEVICYKKAAETLRGYEMIKS